MPEGTTSWAGPLMWTDDPIVNSRLIHIDQSYQPVRWNDYTWDWETVTDQVRTTTTDHTESAEELLRAIINIPYVRYSGKFEFSPYKVEEKEDTIEPPTELLFYLEQYGKEAKPDED